MERLDYDLVTKIIQLYCRIEENPQLSEDERDAALAELTRLFRQAAGGEEQQASARERLKEFMEKAKKLFGF